MIEKSDRKSPANSNIKVLFFFLNHEIYAIPVTDISEVNRIPVETAKTLKEGIMMGFLNFHGSAVCILNLKQILGVKPFELNATPGWIAVRNNNSFICLAVDGFLRFMEISGHNLSTLPVLKEQQEMGKIKFYGRVDNDLIPVLDIKYILDLFQKENQERERDPRPFLPEQLL